MNDNFLPIANGFICRVAKHPAISASDYTFCHFGFGGTLMKKVVWLAATAALAMFPTIVAAQEKGLLGAIGDGNVYEPSLKALTILLVLAILLENALAVIFNWRLFLIYFSRKGVRTLVMVAVSWVIVAMSNLDVVAELIRAYTGETPPSPDPSGRWFVTQLLTALILSGGSAGVYSVMKSLGYRKDVPDEVITPKPAWTKGWISVRTTAVEAKGPILVKVQEVTPATPPAPIAGIVGGRRTPLKDIFFRNPNYFPQSEGYPLDVGKAYEITLESVDANGNLIAKPAANNPIALAPGAIVDLYVRF